MPTPKSQENAINPHKAIKMYMCLTCKRAGIKCELLTRRITRNGIEQN